MGSIQSHYSLFWSRTHRILLQLSRPDVCYNDSKIMRPMVARIKPANGISSLLHGGLLSIFPLLLFVLVRLDFIPLAFIMVLLSKWRMFAVRPRFWLANIRANSVDIIVALAVLTFMIESGTFVWQFMWAVVYALWLVVLKPGASVLYTSLQALVALFGGLIAAYLAWDGAASYVLVLATGLLCYLTARHFFDSFDEPYARLLSYMWGYFGAAMAWVLSHWLLFYGYVAQPAVLLVVLGSGLATLYYLDHFDRLSGMVRRQFLFGMAAIVALVLVLSNWGNKIV